MNTDGQKSDLQGGSNKDFLLKDETHAIDTKVIDRITDNERGQMLNYLRITNLRVGLILNFKHPRLEWERIAL